MKTEQEIKAASYRVDTSGTKYSGMTYEEGILEALDWVLENIHDDEFEYSPDTKD